VSPLGRREGRADVGKESVVEPFCDFLLRSTNPLVLYTKRNYEDPWSSIIPFKTFHSIVTVYHRRRKFQYAYGDENDFSSPYRVPLPSVLLNVELEGKFQLMAQEGRKSFLFLLAQGFQQFILPCHMFTAPSYSIWFQCWYVSCSMSPFLKMPCHASLIVLRVKCTRDLHTPTRKSVSVRSTNFKSIFLDPSTCNFCQLVRSINFEKLGLLVVMHVPRHVFETNFYKLYKNVMYTIVWEFNHVDRSRIYISRVGWWAHN